MSPHQTPTRTRSAAQTSILAGLLCYLCWGLFPLFFPLLKPAGALEILSGRIVFSLFFVTLALLVTRAGWGWLREVFSTRTWKLLVVAAVLIAGNWLTYIWAVNSNHVVEASLGYFINPLVSIALGMVVLRERLERAGKIGCALAALGVGVIASEAWRTVWISLALAFTFGFSGLVKKRVRVTPLQGLFLESAFLAPFAVAWMAWLAISGTGVYLHSTRAFALLVTAGLLTAVPLWLSAIAAPGIPLGTLGILQYVGPTIQFMLGLFVFGQVVSGRFWFGLVLVWIGCVIYVAGAVRAVRR